MHLSTTNKTTTFYSGHNFKITKDFPELKHRFLSNIDA